MTTSGGRAASARARIEELMSSGKLPYFDATVVPFITGFAFGFLILLFGESTLVGDLRTVPVALVLLPVAAYALYHAVTLSRLEVWRVAFFNDHVTYGRISRRTIKYSEIERIGELPKTRLPPQRSAFLVLLKSGDSVVVPLNPTSPVVNSDLLSWVKTRLQAAGKCES